MSGALSRGFVLLLAAFMIPFAADRTQMGTWVATCVIAISGVILPLALRKVPATASLQVQHGALLAAEAFVAIAVPSIWYLAAVMAVASTTATAFSSRYPLALGMAMVTAVIITTTGAMAGHENWAATSTIVVLATPIALLNGRASIAADDRQATALNDLVATAKAVIWESDLDTGEIIAVAGTTAEVSGYEPSEWAHLDHAAQIHPADLEQFWIDADSFDEEGGVLDRAGRFRHRDGHYVAIRDQVRRVETTAGRRLIRGVTTDVSAEYETRRALRNTRDIVDRMRGAVVILVNKDDGLMVDSINAAADQLLGSSSAMIGANISDLFGDPYHDDVTWAIDACNQKREAYTFELVQLERATGSSAIVDIEVMPLSGGDVGIVLHDVTDDVEAERLIRHQANHDDLTGLANRSALTRAGSTALKLREGDDPVALLMVDLDRFKEVNDTLGHSVGDEFLGVIAARMASIGGPDCLVARIGGDEFALLLSRDGSEERAIEVANAIAEACSTPVSVSGITITIGASVGIALAPQHGQDMSTLLRRADLAMYEAKEAGVDWRTATQDSEEPAVRRLILAGQVGDAIRNREFELWFQPKVALGSNAVTGFEGLIRWRHPEFGLLTPADFLDIIELSGHTTAFDRFVVEEGTNHIVRCRDVGHAVPVALNMSARALHDAQIATFISECLMVNDIVSELLVIELTEHAVNEDLKRITPIMEGLAELGVGISIDDFGTGHSSLTRLRDLPVSEIKIDRSFVSGVADNDDDRIIVRSTIDLARTLGLGCIAEGVETHEVEQALMALGCESAQGYLYSKPVPADDAIAFLVERREAYSG